MLNRILAVVVALSLLTACATKPRPPIEPLRLRVLTYNIHHGRGADGLIDLERLADVINRAEPDLVALQEVDVKTKRSGGVDQAAKLGELTGMHHTFAEAMPFQGGGYGNAVLSRYPILASHKHQLPSTSEEEPRAAAVISIQPWAEGLPRLVVASTHLSHQSGDTRRKQAGALIGNRAYNGLATIVAGDFNFLPDSEPYRLLQKARWVDTAGAFGSPKPTCPADQPTMRIDYIFVSPAERWRVIDVKVLDEPIASDHAPMLVELEYVYPEP